MSPRPRRPVAWLSLIVALAVIGAQAPSLAADEPGTQPAAVETQAARQADATPTPEPHPTVAPAADSTPEPRVDPKPEPEPEARPEPRAERAEDPTPQPDQAGDPTPVPDEATGPTPKPDPTPEATDPTAEASPMPEPNADPTPAPDPTPDPDRPPSEPRPSMAPEPSVDPESSMAPEPSVDPDASATPEPSAGASPEADLSPEPSLEASPAPEASPEPSASPDPVPTIRTNHTDYAPGALVLVEGEGWRPFEPVDLVINDDEGRTWQDAGSVVADASGAITYEFRLPTWFVATYTVVATGADGREARWTFSDSIGTGPGTTGDNGNPGASELTIPTPSAVAGRLLLAQVVVTNLTSTNAICTPSGWTLIRRTNNGSSVSVATFYRVTTTSEPTSTTWRLRSSSAYCSSTSGTLSGKGAVGNITAYAGVSTSSPISGSSGITATSSASVAAPSLSAPSNAIVVRAFGGSAAAAITTASTSSTGVANSQVFSRLRSGSLAPASAAADADQPTAGATGTLTASNGVTGYWAAQTIVLAPSGTQPALTLTLSSSTAQLGTNLTPDGVASDASGVSVDIDAANPSTGACYSWAGSMTVVSTVAYDVLVEAAAANPRLDLLSADPATYAACTSGEPIAAGMFASANPAGAWLTGRSATTGRSHPYWLGLDVRWADTPASTLGAATLTFTASVDW